MVYTKAIYTLYLGLATFGGGVVTIAQGVFDPTAVTIERIVGGGVLMTVAVFIVLWSRQMTKQMATTLETSLKTTQSTLDQTIKILEKERESWHLERVASREERDSLRSELIETRTLLQEERRLRISLENMGLADRRSDEIPDVEDPPS